MFGIGIHDGKPPFLDKRRRKGTGSEKNGNSSKETLFTAYGCDERPSLSERKLIKNLHYFCTKNLDIIVKNLPDKKEKGGGKLYKEQGNDCLL